MSESLEVYSGVKRCPKCGAGGEIYTYRDVKVQWFKSTDRLEFSCKCGYSWHMLPMDKNK